MINLLIVDDEKEQRDSLLNDIDWTGLGVSRVMTAQNGLDALAVMENITPDILLCDINMPRMNGLQLGIHISQQNSLCKIIFLSAHPTTANLISAIQIGAVDFWIKPISIDKIIPILNRVTTECMIEKTSSMQKYAAGINPRKFYVHPSIPAKSFLPPPDRL